MSFESLEDAERAHKDLQAGCETMLTTLKAYQIVLSALVATHPKYDQFQLCLTSFFEGPGVRAWEGDLDAKQAESLRLIVESLQQIKPVSGQIDPLARIRKP